MIAPPDGESQLIRGVVVVTGAGGLVGKALCQAMSRHRWLVRATTRRIGPEVATVAKCVLVPNIADRDTFAHAFDGADVVVHLAARVHVMKEDAADALAAFRRVNVEGTRAVYAAAREAGVRRVVFLSSVKAMGEGSAVPYRESDTPRPVDPYGVSKLEAEQLLAEERALGGPEFVVLRPPLVYGPGVRGNFRRLLQLAAVSGRLPLPLGAIANQRSLVSMANLVSAIETVASHPAAADQTFLVSDGEDLSTSTLIAHLAIGLGRPARLFHWPERLLRAAARVAGRTNEAERLFGSLQVDSSKIRNRLGWNPPQNLTAGLEETAAWWRREALR